MVFLFTLLDSASNGGVPGGGGVRGVGGGAHSKGLHPIAWGYLHPLVAQGAAAQRPHALQKQPLRICLYRWQRRPPAPKGWGKKRGNTWGSTWGNARGNKWGAAATGSNVTQSGAAHAAHVQIDDETPPAPPLDVWRQYIAPHGRVPIGASVHVTLRAVASTAVASTAVASTARESARWPLRPTAPHHLGEGSPLSCEQREATAKKRDTRRRRRRPAAADTAADTDTDAADAADTADDTAGALAPVAPVFVNDAEINRAALATTTAAYTRSRERRRARQEARLRA